MAVPDSEVVAQLKLIVAALGGDITVNSTFNDQAGGSTATAVAAGTLTPTVIKASAGRLCRVLVTALGLGAVEIYDHASLGSGKLIGYIEASAAAGTVREFLFPAANGIVVKGSATLPAVTVSFD